MRPQEGAPARAIRGAASLGPRLSVRRRMPDGALGDVVGHLLHRSPESLVLLPEDGPEIHVDAVDVVAARAIPERVVRPASSACHVARLAARCWPGVEWARLGGWVLRAGNGFTRRANSVLVCGDPGHPAEEALAMAADWYADRGLPLRLVVPGTSGARPPLPGEWRRELVTDLLVADLGALGLQGSLPSGTRLGVADTPTPAWRDLWRDGATNEPTSLAVLTAGPARYLTVEGESGVLACARSTLRGRWVHIACVTVRPDRRREGIGRGLMAAALADARSVEPRTRFCLLEVEAQNTAAQAMYADLGFRRHHSWTFFVPGRPVPGRMGSPTADDVTDRQGS